MKAKYHIVRDSGIAPVIALVTRLCTLPGVKEASVSGRELKVTTLTIAPAELPDIVTKKTRGNVVIELISAE